MSNRRLTTVILGLMLALPAATACTSDDNTQRGPTIPTRSPYYEAEVTPNVQPTTPMPSKVAVCGATPPAGSFDYQFRTEPGQPIRRLAINHTKVDCGKPFTEYVDFTYLGDSPRWTCTNNPRADDIARRPCDEPFKQEASQSSRTLNYDPANPTQFWRPREGTNPLTDKPQDPLQVDCQVIGDTMQNNRPGGPEQSNVWNRIRDPRIAETGMGYIPDLWMGNAGWRQSPCNPADSAVPSISNKPGVTG